MKFSEPASASWLPRNPNESTDYNKMDKSQQQHNNFGYGAKQHKFNLQPADECPQPSLRTSTTASISRRSSDHSESDLNNPPTTTTNKHKQPRRRRHSAQLIVSDEYEICDIPPYGHSNRNNSSSGRPLPRRHSVQDFIISDEYEIRDTLRCDQEGHRNNTSSSGRPQPRRRHSVQDFIISDEYEIRDTLHGLSASERIKLRKMRLDESMRSSSSCDNIYNEQDGHWGMTEEGQAKKELELSNNDPNLDQESSHCSTKSPQALSIQELRKMLLDESIYEEDWLINHRGMEGQIIMSCSKPEHHLSNNGDGQGEIQRRSQSPSHCPLHCPSRSLSFNDYLTNHLFEKSSDKSNDEEWPEFSNHLFDTSFSDRSNKEEWPELNHTNLSHHDNVSHHSSNHDSILNEDLQFGNNSQYGQELQCQSQSPNEEWPELSHVNLSHHDNLTHHSNISRPDEDIISNKKNDGDDDCRINTNDLVDIRHHLYDGQQQCNGTNSITSSVTNDLIDSRHDLEDGQQQCNLKKSSMSRVAIGDNHDTSSDYQRTKIRTSNNSQPLPRQEIDDSKTNDKKLRSNNNDSILCEDVPFDNTTRHRRQNRRASMPNITITNSHKNSHHHHHGEVNNSMTSTTSFMADYIAMKLTMAELQSELQVAQGKLQDRNGVLQRRNMELEEENCCFRRLFEKLDRLGKLEGVDTDYLWKDKVGGRLLETTIHDDHEGLAKLRNNESEEQVKASWKKPELDWGSLGDGDRTPSPEKGGRTSNATFVEILVQDLPLSDTDNDDTPSPSHNDAIKRSSSSCRSFFERRKSSTSSATSEDQLQQQSQQQMTSDPVEKTSTSLVEKIRNIPRRLSISKLLQYPEAEVDGTIPQYVQFPDVDVHDFRYSDLSYGSSLRGRRDHQESSFLPVMNP